MFAKLLMIVLLALCAVGCSHNGKKYDWVDILLSDDDDCCCDHDHKH